MEAYFIPKEELTSLLGMLREKGYTVITPTLVDGVIRLEVEGEIPTGVVDEQEAGYYRTKMGTNEIFSYSKGPDSFKKFLWPAYERLVTITKEKKKLVTKAEEIRDEKLAFFGVRACDLAALEVLDRVLMKDGLIVTRYRKVREDMFIVAVNCLRPSPTCFCLSMGTGPEVRNGYDLLLTELSSGILIEAGSDKGREFASRFWKAKPEDLEEKEILIERAKKSFVRSLDKEEVRKALIEKQKDEVWKEMGEKCLACGNCSMVCPTCFCSDVIDRLDVAGKRDERIRMWDSCFNMEFTYTAGLYLRKSIASRYRQWFSHKFAYWVEQFGCFGCVGCGRCITWCPVGIDITEVASKVVGRC